MREPGEPRRRGRRGADSARAAAAAHDARDAASDAFVQLEQALRFIGGRVTVFADLDAAAAAGAQREFAALKEAADGASAAYIAVLDGHDLSGDDRTPAEYDAARRAFAAVTERLVRRSADLDGFAERLAPRIRRLEGALDMLPPRLTAAREAVTAAGAAVAAARAAGLDVAQPEETLAQARTGLEVLGSRGLGGLGLSGALDRADEVRRLAEDAAREAAELPKRVENIRNSVTAVRTRAQAVAGRLEPVEAAMRRLLRGYAQACWQDLRGAPAAIEEGLARARERIAEAERLVSRGEWPAAERALTAARTELSAADRRAAQVTGRVAELDAASADPAAPAEAVRFAVRDAQRLAVSLPGGAPPEHARALDALVERLDGARDRLRGAHPDYWAYLRELDAIRTAAGDVVARIRAERAAGAS
ncbi:molecular chaperone DnaJ [Actinomadura craniellae]|uniref:molecular chaperone DnaJ n=1 Tax=Actinomadura craniellae TaxID=2231787 RepID=UPI0013148598|nr:molecular chaperone DnaJ [Actinomadura craniellae]